MLSFLLLTTLLAPAQTPPTQERLVPIPRTSPHIHVADKLLSVEAPRSDAGRSRIYGGIHYEFDDQEGLRTGREVAIYSAQHFLLPVEGNALTSRTQLISTRRRPISINLADRPRGERRTPISGR